MDSSLETTYVPGQVVTERTHLFLPSLTRWIGPTVEYLKNKAVMVGACQESRSGKLMVALHEALSNSVIHGNLELASDLKERGDDCFADALAQREAEPRFASRTVDILVDYDSERCRWIFTDQGRGFDVARVLERCLSDDPEVMLSSGRGILLMRSFLDEVKYEQGGRRVILTLYRGSGEEKRGSDRVVMHHTLTIVPILPDGSVDWGAAYEAVSRNFSEQGIALIQEGPVAHERLLVGLASGGDVVYVPAEVRHVRTLTGHIVELGCRFQTRLELGITLPTPTPAMPNPQQAAVQEAIVELLEKQSNPYRATDERRAFPRTVYNERIEILTSPGAEPLVGFGRDLSRGGVAFITLCPLPREVTVVFWPVDAGPALRVRSQVVRCIKVREGFYDIGVRFLHLV